MIVLRAETRVAPENRGIRTEGSILDRVSRVVEKAEGYTVVTRTSEHDGKTYSLDEVIHPEYAPVRPYSFGELRHGIVARIGGQNYRITVALDRSDVDDWSDLHDGIPSGATVRFAPTDEPESVCAPFDEKKARAERIAGLRKTIRQFRRKGDERNVEFLQRQVDALKSGVHRVHPRADVLLFGPPCFIQNPIFPAHEGRAACCLMVLETGWGDSGNVNLLFATDAEGRPCKVWFEASCC